MDTLTVLCSTHRVLGPGRRDSDPGAQAMVSGGRKSKRWQWGWEWGWGGMGIAMGKGSTTADPSLVPATSVSLQARSVSPS